MLREWGVGELLCSNSLFGMCHWMGLHFHNWTDYNKVEFIYSYMNGVTHIWDFGGKNILVIRDLKKGRLISG